MAVSAKETTEVYEFHRELIDRFFNPKSYFLFSFMTDLKNRASLLEKPENVAAIGLVVDEIINSEDKFGKIQELTHIPGFDYFYQTLMEKVEYLRVAHLTTQQMMETVKSLGIALAQAFEQIMANEASRKILLEHVGIAVETTPGQAEPTSATGAKTTEQKPEDDEPIGEKCVDLSKLDNLFTAAHSDEKAPDPWDFFYEDVNNKLNQIEKLLNDFEKAPNNRALLSQVKSNFQELREWAMIQGNEGIEAIAMRLLIAMNLALRTFSYGLIHMIPPLREALQALREVNKFGWAGENLDIIPVVIRHLERLYDEIKKSTVSASEAEMPSSQSLPESPASEEMKAVDSIIHSPFEEKQPDVLEKEENLPPEGAGDHSQLREDTLQITEEAPAEAEEDDRTETALSMDFWQNPVAKETTPEANQAEAKQEPELDLDGLQETASAAESEGQSVKIAEEQFFEPPVEEPPDEASLDETVSEMEKLYYEMFPEEYEDQPAAKEHEAKKQVENPTLENPVNSIEEDADLDKALDSDHLLSDSGESNTQEQEGFQLPGEEDVDLHEIIDEIAAEEPVSSSASDEEPLAPDEASSPEESKYTVSSPQVNTPISQEAPPIKESPQFLQRGGRDLVEEAEMYFQFMQKAFAALEKNPSSHRSFEDIELACYSLKILARKLGYTFVANIAEKIEEIFQLVLSGELLPKPEQMAYLSSVVIALQKRGLENHLGDAEISHWAADVFEKISHMRKTVPTISNDKHSQESKSESPEEDPLEFLMYEDTGKYFKQLLDD